MIVTFSPRRTALLDEDDYVSAEIEAVISNPEAHGASRGSVSFFDEYMEEPPPENGECHAPGFVEAVVIPNDTVHPLLTWLADEEKLPRVLPARKWRLFAEYGVNPEKHFFTIMGSWRYGLGQAGSDYDLCLVVDSPEERSIVFRTMEYNRVAGGAAVMAFTIGEIHAGLRRGNRWAWEAATAPPNLRSRGPSSIRSVLPQMVAVAMSQSSWRSDYLDGSVRYVREYGARLLGSPLVEPKPWIRRWKAAKGWAYKLGYYIAVDALICRRVLECGEFDPRAAVESSEARRKFFEYKWGRVTFQEWMDDMSGMMPRETFDALRRATAP